MARGAAVNAAFLNPRFGTQAFKIRDYNNFPVSLTYTFKEEGKEAAPKNYDKFFAVGQKFPMT